MRPALLLARDSHCRPGDRLRSIGNILGEAVALIRGLRFTILSEDRLAVEWPPAPWQDGRAAYEPFESSIAL